MRHVETELGYGNVSGFIMSLLNQCELTEPNGAPLFTYQLSVDSYANLKSQLQARVPSSASFKNVYWCAAFCLFGAEWYRREYQSGWSWSGIFSVLGFELEPIQRADVVIKGLTYWKRPINRYESNRNDYLGSLFSEGGLPFTLLASEGGRFQTMFKRLLTEFDRAKSFGIPPIPLIEKQLKGMPDAFQAESTITLLHDMVSNLYALIDTYNLEEKNAPSEYLDSVIKNWRVSFPIPLDTETGDKLLTGLLNSAAAQRKEKKRQRKRLSLSQWLSNTSELSFSANVEVSKQLALPITRNDLTAPVVEVLIFEGSSKIADLGMARAELSNQGMMLHMRKTEVSFKRDHHEAALSVVIMVAGKVAYLEEIPGSTLPLRDMPIVLKQENEKLIVIGCGSVSEKADMLTVLIPNDVEAEPSEARLVASEQLNEFQKQTFTGELTINYPGDDIADTYHVSNKSDAYHRESIEIKGEEIEFPSQGGYPVYKGMPTILCHHPHARVYIGDCEVGKAQRLGEIFGRQVLRVKAEGKTLYRRKIAILPRDLEISLRPGTKPNMGSIAIASEKAFIYNVDTGIETKSRSEQGVKYIELISDSVPPVYVNLQIQANLLADPISLAIPFPCRGALVFDASGNELPRHCAINDLLGARILLFRAPHMTRTGFDIELKAPTSARDNPSYVFHYEVQKSVEEVSLFELRERIKELLATAQNHELDEVVRVIISGQGFGFKQYTVGL